MLVFGITIYKAQSFTLPNWETLYFKLSELMYKYYSLPANNIKKSNIRKNTIRIMPSCRLETCMQILDGFDYLQSKFHPIKLSLSSSTVQFIKCIFKWGRKTTVYKQVKNIFFKCLELSFRRLKHHQNLECGENLFVLL